VPPSSEPDFKHAILLEVVLDDSDTEDDEKNDNEE